MALFSHFGLLFEKLSIHSLEKLSFRDRAQLKLRLVWFFRSPHNSDAVVLFDHSSPGKQNGLTTLRKKMVAEIVFGSIPIAYKFATRKLSYVVMESQCIAAAFCKLSDEVGLLTAVSRNKPNHKLYRLNKFGLVLLVELTSFNELRLLESHARVIGCYLECLENELYLALGQNASVSDDVHYNLFGSQFTDKAFAAFHKFAVFVHNSTNSPFCYFTSRTTCADSFPFILDLLMETTLSLEKKDTNYFMSEMFTALLSVITPVKLSHTGGHLLRKHQRPQLILVGTNKTFSLMKCVIAIVSYFLLNVADFYTNFTEPLMIASNVKLPYFSFSNIQIMCSASNSFKAWSALSTLQPARNSNIFMANFNDWLVSKFVLSEGEVVTIPPSTFIVYLLECVTASYKLGTSKDFCINYFCQQMILLAHKTTMLDEFGSSCKELKAALGIDDY